MRPHKSIPIIPSVLGRMPLRAVLVFPFVLQVLSAVGIVGYLSIQNRQQAVTYLADQLLSEVSHRIQQNLEAHLAIPAAINRTNAGVIKTNQLNLQNLSQWDPYLLQQVQVYHPTVLYIGVGNPRGEYRSGEQLDDFSLRLNIVGDETGFRSYAVNELGQQFGLKTHLPNFRLRQRQEYQSIAQSSKPIWTPVFTSVLQPTLLIARADPIVNLKQGFQGFVIASLRLDGIGEFLHQLQVGQTGQAFIIDRQGRLLATSTGELPFRDYADSRKLIQAGDSSNLLTRTTANYIKRSGVLQQSVNTLQKAKLDVNQTPHYLAVLPFRDADGLDWLVVVVIPESDFLAQIHSHNQVTFLLCLGAVVIAILLGILIAHWITQPLLELNAAAKKIAQGDFNQAIVLGRQDEMGELADAFNQMAHQLQQSFADMESLNQALTFSKDQLAAYNQTLEAQIAERTEALERANQELERLATTDSLMQIANRRRFDDYLYQEWNHGLRCQAPLSLILCDVDYFKSYNDYYGHQRGDDCLRQIAQAIQQALNRSTDLVARYGGEEFGVILPFSDAAGAALVAQSIQAEIQRLQCPHQGSAVSSQVTLSLGIASTIPHRSRSPEALVAAADIALYEAKTQGRDRYCVHELLSGQD